MAPASRTVNLDGRSYVVTRGDRRGNVTIYELRPSGSRRGCSERRSVYADDPRVPRILRRVRRQVRLERAWSLAPSLLVAVLGLGFLALLWWGGP